MEITDPSLGMFSLLPIEVRMMIWKYFIPHLHRSHSLPRYPDRLSKAHQMILLTSRAIFAEIAGEIPYGYNGNVITILVQPEYQSGTWIRATTKKGVRWIFKTPSDALTRGFSILPWHRLKVEIRIQPPQGWRCDHLVSLYMKIRALVEILKEARTIRSLWVKFEHTKDRSWFSSSDGSQPLSSLKHKAISLPWRHPQAIPGAQFDYEFLFLQFVQLRNVKDIKMYSSEIEGGKRESRLMSDSFVHAQQLMDKNVPGEEKWALHRYLGRPVEEQIDLLYLMVVCVLSDLPSETRDWLFLNERQCLEYAQGPSQRALRSLVRERLRRYAQ